MPDALPDEAIRRVLDLVERTHLRAASLDEPALLLAAVQAIPDSKAHASQGEVHAVLGGRTLRLRLAEGASLPERLGPPLEAALESALGAALGALSPRDAARARLLDGLLRRIDRWSSASTGRRRLDQAERREGRIAGAGVRIGRREGEIRVLGVLSPAAGLREGDALLAVGGLPVEGRTTSEVLSLLRGEPGTSVEVTTRRGTVSVTRRELPRASASHVLRGDGVLVLRLAHVSRRSGSEARAFLAAHPERRGVVLDLRGNSGGSMIGGAEVASCFLDGGLVAGALDEDDRPVAGLRDRIEAPPGGDVTTPLAVLVDRRTGSAAELLAAALAWRGRATLCGERTFGKVTVGKPHVLPGADLAVTITSAVMRAAGRRLPAAGLDPQWELDPRAEGVIDVIAQRLLGPAVP